jgi:hypothetical protein
MIEESRAWGCNQAHIVQEFIECAIDRRPGRQAGRCLQTQGKGAKSGSCEAAWTGAPTGCARGRDGEARKRPRKEPWRRPRAVYHGCDPERAVHRGRFRPFPRGKSRRAPSGPTTLGDKVFLGFKKYLLLFIYFVM